MSKPLCWIGQRWRLKPPRPWASIAPVTEWVQGRPFVISFDNVAYNYGGGELLSDMSLRLAPGSFHFLTGPSGSGKTTFLKLAYAELLPTAGHVTVFDRDVRSLTRDDVAMVRRRVGVVHQDVQFLDHLPLAANVALPLTVAGRDGHAQDLTDLLGWVGLGKLADALPPSLSGGERQRAALARAIENDIQQGIDQIRQAARALNMGGVGFYPRSGFVHLDTGPVRYW